MFSPLFTPSSQTLDFYLPAGPDASSLSLVHTGRCSSGPLQRRRVTLLLHCNWLPDAEREAAVPGGLQPGEDGQTFSSPQPRVLPAAAALQTLSC